MRKNILFLGIILALLVIAGCKQPTDEATGSVPIQPLVSPSPTSDDNLQKTSTNQVSILGKEGFDPAEVTIKKGDKLVWTNDDIQKKAMVLNLKKGTKPTWSRVEVSGLIKLGETYQRTFDEAGDYEYWTTAYGVFGKIKVTE